jgi:hypothetical protein
MNPSKDRLTRAERLALMGAVVRGILAGIARGLIDALLR